MLNDNLEMQTTKPMIASVAIGTCSVFRLFCLFDLVWFGLFWCFFLSDSVYFCSTFHSFVCDIPISNSCTIHNLTVLSLLFICIGIEFNCPIHTGCLTSRVYWFYFSRPFSSSVSHFKLASSYNYSLFIQK